MSSSSKALHRSCPALDILDEIIAGTNSRSSNKEKTSSKSSSSGKKKKTKKSTAKKSTSKKLSASTSAIIHTDASMFVQDIVRQSQRKSVMQATWERLPDNSTAVLKDRHAKAVADVKSGTTSSTSTSSTASISTSSSAPSSPIKANRTTTTTTPTTSDTIMTSNMNSLSDMVTSLMSKLDQQTKVAKQRRQTVTDLKFERAVLGKQQLKLKQQLDATQKQLHETQATVQALERQREVDQNLIRELQSQLQQDSTMQDSQTVLELQRQLQDLQQRHKQLQDRLKKATREHQLASVKHASDKVLGSLKINNTKNAVVSATDEHLADKCMQLWALQTDHKKLKHEHAAQSDYVQQLEQALEGDDTTTSSSTGMPVYQQLLAAQKALSALDADHQAERERTRMLTAQLEELQAECSNLRARMTASGGKNTHGNHADDDDMMTLAGTVMTADDSVSTLAMHDMSDRSIAWAPAPLHSPNKMIPSTKKTSKKTTKKQGWTAPTPLWESA